MKELHVVAGPTASGKTKYAIELAKKIDGELINADARQIYKYLDIGTNKGVIKKVGSEFYDLPIFEIENSGVLIHLLSFLYPDQEYSSFEYQQAVLKVLPNIWNKGKVPILVGGTGLYIDLVLHPERYDSKKAPSAELRTELNSKGRDELQAMLEELVPGIRSKMNQSDWNNPRRLVRRIEIAMSGEGNNNSDLSTLLGTDVSTTVHSIETSSSELRERINDRVLSMWQEGLVEEVSNVLKLGYNRDCRALQGIGYREVLEYLDGKISESECIQKIQTSHYRYAKRQMTWFKKYLS